MASVQNGADPLGWQSRTMGARTDSEGKKWSLEMKLQRGHWMLEFKFNHSYALHTPDCVDEPVVTGDLYTN